MTPTDQSLLEELEPELQGKVQKLMLSAYLREANPASILKVALKVIEKVAQKHESQ